MLTCPLDTGFRNYIDKLYNDDEVHMIPCEVATIYPGSSASPVTLNNKWGAYGPQSFREIMLHIFPPLSHHGPH